MTAIELAKQLGLAIKEDPRLATLDAAKSKYEADAVVLAKMSEYSAQKAALNQEYLKPEQDEAVIELIKERINVLYGEITTNENYIRYNAAQEAFNDFMTEVNAEITYNITGERPCSSSGCSSCSSGSCSSKK